MQVKRYAHSSIFMNGYVYVLGGYAHKDVPNENPVTLASVEKYSLHENTWTYVSSMNEQRAFTACVGVDS